MLRDPAFIPSPFGPVNCRTLCDPAIMTDDKYDGAMLALARQLFDDSDTAQQSAYEQLREFSKSFDQMMVTLAAGAIAGSVALLEKVDVFGRRSILAAWIALTLALLCILVSYLLGIRILRGMYGRASVNAGRAKLLEIALSLEDAETAKNTLEDARKAWAIDSDRSLTRSVLSLLNWASVAALVVGVVLLLIGASRVTVA